MKDTPNITRDWTIYELESLIRWTRNERGLSIEEFSNLIRNHFDRYERESLVGYLLADDGDNE